MVGIPLAATARYGGFARIRRRSRCRTLMLASALLRTIAILPRRAGSAEALGVRVLVWHSSILLVALIGGVLLDVPLATLGVEVLASAVLLVDIDLRVGTR